MSFIERMKEMSAKIQADEELSEKELLELQELVAQRYQTKRKGAPPLRKTTAKKKSEPLTKEEQDKLDKILTEGGFSL